MSRVLYHLGRLCVRLRWIVLALWLIAAIALIGTAQKLGTTTNDDLTLPNTGSQAATDLLTDKFSPQQNGSSPIVFAIKEGSIHNEPYKSAIEAGFHAVEKLPNVDSVTNPYSDAGTVTGLISANDHVAMLPILLTTPSTSLTIPEAQKVFDTAAAEGRKAGMEVEAGGTIGAELASEIQDDADKIGLAAAAIILTFVLGSLIAMGIPLITALFGLGIGLSIVTVLGTFVNVPSVAPTLATMIGLGVGIDYALFMVSRHISQLKTGMEIRESIARATATSGGAIVFAGGTVVVAISSLAVAKIPIVTALGYTSAIVVFVAVLAAITLMPAVLALVGKGVTHLKVPAFLRPKDKDPMDTIWAKFAHEVANHPLIASAVALVILGPLIFPFFSLRFGIPDTAVDPTSQTQRRAYDLIATNFGPGYNGPFLIAVELTPPAAPDPAYKALHHTTVALGHELQGEKQGGHRTRQELHRTKGRLKEDGKRLTKRAAPITAQGNALVAKAARLEARKTQLDTRAAVLTAKKLRLESEGARLEQDAARMVGQLRKIATETAKVLDKIAHTADPDKRARLEARLGRLKNRAERIIRKLEHLNTKKSHLEMQGKRLTRAAARLTQQGLALEREGAKLTAQGEQLAVRAAPLERQKARLERKGVALQKRATIAQRQAPRKEAHGKAQLKRFNKNKHSLEHQLKQAGGKAEGTDPRLQSLRTQLAAADGVTAVSPPDVNKEGTAAVLSVTPDASPASQATSDLVVELRTSTIPPATTNNGLTVYVGGETAAYVDLASLISKILPLNIAVVIALSFILLMLAFRSIVIPASAAVMNLLSVAAAYGVLTAVFQWGWGLDLIGIHDATTVPIASYVPLMMFAVLFGLSMDYEVFLMSQIKEHHDEGANTHDAVVAGLAISSRIITSAALIMVTVFGSFILNINPTVKQFGVGLAVAVAIDATIVRTLLVPASLTLLGKANWWFPKWLDWLPHLDIEGTHAFDTKEAPEEA